eukprot:g3509.t1
MGAARKLQAEIDRTLKKVQEGIIEFDEIWDKANFNSYHSIPAFLLINGSDIKDKSSLMDARKNIEKKMEQFKNCEKEAKTKAFSKAGLGQAAKLDPEEKARQATREWLNEQVEALRMQIDEFEAELESFNTSRRGKKPSDRQQVLEDCVLRHQGHISRLEQCMRCLDNCTVTYQEIDDLRDNVEYYVSENQEDDLCYTTVDESYASVLDRLNDVTLGLQSVTHTTKVSKIKDMEVELAEREREKERAAAAAVKAQLLSHGSSVTASLIEEEKKPTPPAPSTTTTTTQQQTTTKAPTQSTGGVTAKRRVSLSEPPSENHVAVEESELENSTNQIRGVQGSGNDKRENLNSTPNGNLSFASAAAGRSPIVSQKSITLSHSSKGEDGDFPKLPSMVSEKSKSLDLPGELRPKLKQNSIECLNVQKSSFSNDSLSYSQSSESHGLIPSVSKSASSSSAKPSVNDVTAIAVPNHSGDTSIGGSRDEVDPMLSSMSLEDLTKSLGMPCANIKGVISPPSQFEGNPAASLQLLRACNRGAIPQPIDGDYRVQLSQKTSPSIIHQLPASYPIHRLPQLENASFYQQLDTEGLFYAFYFHPETVLQYCAAKELKRQSWRYHLEHQFWFQPTGDPKVKNEDYEEGCCIYFDRVLTSSVPGESGPELNGWCYRRKDNFMFTKDQVEDDSH